MKEPIRLIWECEYCNDVVISYSHIRHDMNFCDCGKSAVDLEEGYQRGVGKVKDISRQKLVDGNWVSINDSDKTMTNEEIQTLVDELLPKNMHTIDERIFALRIGKAVREEIGKDKPEDELPLNFWKRLEGFISDVRVNDPMSEEEKQMILRVSKSKKN